MEEVDRASSALVNRFWIYDFGFWINSRGKRTELEIRNFFMIPPTKAGLVPKFFNPKSKIQNPCIPGQRLFEN